VVESQSFALGSSAITYNLITTGKLIPKLAQTKGIELIVMGTVCRTGVAGLIIGNTAENVLRQVDCSVLTVKPEGFVSPVNLDVK